MSSSIFNFASIYEFCTFRRLEGFALFTKWLLTAGEQIFNWIRACLLN